MVEYGHGVNEGAGRFSGSQGGGGGNVDAGSNLTSMLGGFVDDTATVIGGLPPVVLALGAAILVLGLLFVFRKAL